MEDSIMNRTACAIVLSFHKFKGVKVVIIG